MQPTPCDPKVHAHPGLFGRLHGSCKWWLRRCITGYTRWAPGGHQGHACVYNKWPGSYPQCESSVRATMTIDKYVTEILPRRRSLETPQASKHITTDRGDGEQPAVCDGFCVDGKWEYQWVCWEGSTRESHLSSRTIFGLLFSYVSTSFWTLLPSKPHTRSFHTIHQDTKIAFDYSGRLTRTRWVFTRVSTMHSISASRHTASRNSAYEDHLRTSYPSKTLSAAAAQSLYLLCLLAGHEYIDSC